GSADDFDTARTDVVEREQPVLARVDLERDVIEARRRAHARISERDPRLLHVRRQLEQHHVVMLVVDAHEADGAAEVRRPPAARALETQDGGIEFDRSVDVADVNADVPDAIEANGHAGPPFGCGAASDGLWRKSSSYRASAISESGSRACGCALISNTTH